MLARSRAVADDGLPSPPLLTSLVGDWKDSLIHGKSMIQATGGPFCRSQRTSQTQPLSKVLKTRRSK